MSAGEKRADDAQAQNTPETDSTKVREEELDDVVGGLSQKAPSTIAPEATPVCISQL